MLAAFGIVAFYFDQLAPTQAFVTLDSVGQVAIITQLLPETTLDTALAFKMDVHCQGKSYIA